MRIRYSVYSIRRLCAMEIRRLSVPRALNFASEVVFESYFIDRQCVYFPGSDISGTLRLITHMNSKDDAHLLIQNLRSLLLPIKELLDLNVNFTVGGILPAFYHRYMM